MIFTEFCFKVLKLQLTRGQYALARVAFDNRNPETPLERELFGDVVSIPPSARDTIILRCGRGSGKSLLSAAWVIFACVTGDVSACGPGDEATGVIIAPTRDLAKIAFSAGSALIRGSSFLKPMIVSDTSDSITLRRPDGKRVVFRTTAKSSRGTATRGRSYVSVLFDESEFLPQTSGDSVIQDTDLISAVRPRMLPGSKLILASTPWPARSFTADTFESSFGKPLHALAARATTLQLRDNLDRLIKARDEELARDSNNALREFDCVLTDAEGCFFEVTLIDKAVSDEVRGSRVHASVGIDLAFRSDSSALVVVERQAGKVVVVDQLMVQPRNKSPLVPSEVLAEFAAKSVSYNAKNLMSDWHYVESAREHCADYGIDLLTGPTNTKEREKSFVYVRELLREGKLVLPRYNNLLGQLKSVLVAPKPGGGLSITLPRRTGAGHADLVSALVLACWHDRRFGPVTKEKQKAQLPIGIRTKHVFR